MRSEGYTLAEIASKFDRTDTVISILISKARVIQKHIDGETNPVYRKVRGGNIEP